MSEKTHDMLFGLVLGLDGSFFQSTLFFRGLYFGFIFFVDIGRRGVFDGFLRG